MTIEEFVDKVIYYKLPGSQPSQLATLSIQLDPQPAAGFCGHRSTSRKPVDVPFGEPLYRL